MGFETVVRINRFHFDFRGGSSTASIQAGVVRVARSDGKMLPPPIHDPDFDFGPRPPAPGEAKNWKAVKEWDALRQQFSTHYAL
jgi:hypothetical protein